MHFFKSLKTYAKPPQPTLKGNFEDDSVLTGCEGSVETSTRFKLLVAGQIPPLDQRI
jgi:hypothetical protein